MNIKTFLVILILIWMIAVFVFSNQPAKESSKTSGNLIRMIIDKIPSTRDLSEKEKKSLISEWQHIVRKLAHFSIYTLGGILIYAWVNTFKVTLKIKMIFSLILGALYASIDEFHQLFVMGRSGEFRDICIDSSGVLVGILISLCVISIFSRIKRHRLVKKQ